jgi:5'-deoxynucleotidase YfbR-like HD superfamily hydrolase
LNDNVGRHFSEGKTMFLSIREMIVGGPARLRFVYRYSTTRVYYRESVAEHSYFTALYTNMIGRWCLEEHLVKPHGLDMGDLLERALLHDLEEARSGDFPRSFKHSDPQLKAMLEAASEKAFRQIVAPLIRHNSGEFVNPNALVPEAKRLLNVWSNSKDESVAGRILEFADFLSVLGFLLQEGAGAGNKAILEHVEDMCKYFSKFKDERFNFLLPLIGQARDIMLELFPDAKF